MFNYESLSDAIRGSIAHSETFKFGREQYQPDGVSAELSLYVLFAFLEILEKSLSTSLQHLVK